MRDIQKIAVPGVNLPGTIGATWGLDVPTCLRLFGDELPDRIRYLRLTEFIVVFPHEGSSGRLRFLFGDHEGLRRLEMGFGPGTGFWDGGDFWVDPPLEDFLAVFDLLVTAYESELGPPTLCGERKLDLYSSGLVAPVVAREVATWPRPGGRLEVALIYEPYNPSWRRPPWEVRSVRVAWCHSIRRNDG